MKIFQRILGDTLVRRHIFLLAVCFLMVQGGTFAWMMNERIKEQVSMSLNERAKFFAQSYMLLSSLDAEERKVHIAHYTLLRTCFSIQDQQPEFSVTEPDSENEDTRYLRLRILQLLGMMQNDVNFVYPGRDRWGQETVDYAQSWDEFKESSRLMVSVFSMTSRWNLGFSTSHPLDEDDKQDLKALAALPFSDGTWLVGEFLGKPTGAIPTGFFLLAIAVQFLALMLVVFVEIKLLVRPLKAIEKATAHINLDNPGDLPLPTRGFREVKNVARAIRRLSERLSRQIQERFMLLASLSHDLRSPVSKMRVEVEDLQETYPEIMNKTTLPESLDELQSLMDAVISYARTGRNQEQKVNLGMSDFLQAIAEDFQDSGYDVQLIHVDELFMPLYPQSLKRCILNLVQNALDYGGKAGGTSSVAISGERLKKGYQIKIRDFGDGVPEEELKKIFEPFVRLESSRNRSTGGTGLGLSIARNLAEHNNASIILKNKNPGLEAIIYIRG